MSRRQRERDLEDRVNFRDGRPFILGRVDTDSDPLHVIVRRHDGTFLFPRADVLSVQIAPPRKRPISSTGT